MCKCPPFPLRFGCIHEYLKVELNLIQYSRREAYYFSYRIHDERSHIPWIQIRIHDELSHSLFNSIHPIDLFVSLAWPTYFCDTTIHLDRESKAH